MPISESGAGYGPYTRLKQQHFGAVVRTHLAIVGQILRRGWAYPRYVYVDLTAGPGVVQGIEGSPLLFLSEARRQDLAHQALLIDQDTATVAALTAEVERRGLEAGCTLLVGDNAERVEDVVALLERRADDVYGLAYADPNGGELPWAALRRIGWTFDRLDLLVYASATGKKRLRGSGTGEPTYLLDRLAGLHKKHVLLRTPAGAHQWTFALLTNWDGLLGKFGREGFHAITTPTGREIAERLNFSIPEQRARRQAALPFGDTAPTPSTFGTRVSWPSGRSSSSAPADAASGAVGARPPSPTTSATRHGGRSTCPGT